MSKEVYGFEVKDNDACGGSGYMLYTNKGNYLEPVIDSFRNGHSQLFSLEDLVEVLKNNKVSEILTYEPDTEKVCSHPYEITNDDDFNACENDGNWYRFCHNSISGRAKDILNEQNINLKTLPEKDIINLESKLKLHY